MTAHSGSSIIPKEDDQKFMDIAFAEAKDGFEQQGIPIVSRISPRGLGLY